MAETFLIKYRAFISYSHVDTGVAKRLHKALEDFRIDQDLIGRVTEQGSIPRALRPIFRDRDDFTAGRTLSDQTIAALDASAALIVVCSPDSARSENVNAEIRLFKQRHPERPVIPIIARGEPDGGKLECFAPPLRFKVGADGQVSTTPEPEILAADLREEADGFDLATAKVIARMLGLATDDVYRRAERERQRKARVRYSVAAVIAALCVVGGFLFWQSQERGATIARQEQEKSEALAIAQQLLGTSPAAAAVPGQEQSLIGALTAIQESAAKGDADYAKAFELLKAGRGAEAVPLLLAAAEAKKQRADKENTGAAKAYREAAAVASVTEPWKARGLYAEAARLDPTNLDGLLQNAYFQQDSGQFDAAEASYRKVFEMAKSGTNDTALYWAHFGLGDIQKERGDLAKAKETYLSAASIIDRLIQADPDSVTLQRDLSISYNKVGDVLVIQANFPAALKTFQDSLAVIGGLAKAQPDDKGWQRDLAFCYDRIGGVFVSQGKLTEAAQNHNASLDIALRLAAAEPTNPGYQRDVSFAHERVGDVMMERGQIGDAMNSYSKSLDIRERLTKADPQNTLWQYDLANAHDRMGDVHLRERNLEAALKSYEAQLAIMVPLAQSAPNNALWQRALSVSYGLIGDVQTLQNNNTEALANFLKAAVVLDRLSKSDESNAGWQRDLATSYERIGDVYQTQGNFDGARKAFQDALAIYDGLYARNPDDVPSRVRSVVPRWRLADLDPEQAETHLRTSLEILRPLAAEDRLDADRAAWIPQLESQLASHGQR